MRELANRFLLSRAYLPSHANKRNLIYHSDIKAIRMRTLRIRVTLLQRVVKGDVNTI
jgi:hypothetical protein